MIRWPWDVPSPLKVHKLALIQVFVVRFSVQQSPTVLPSDPPIMQRWDVVSPLVEVLMRRQLEWLSLGFGHCNMVHECETLLKL